MNKHAIFGMADVWLAVGVVVLGACLSHLLGEFWTPSKHDVLHLTPKVLIEACGTPVQDDLHHITGDSPRQIVYPFYRFDSYSRQMIYPSYRFVFVPTPGYDDRGTYQEAFSLQLKDSWGNWSSMGIFDTQNRRVDGESIPCLKKQVRQAAVVAH